MTNFKFINKSEKFYIAGASGMVGSAVNRILQKTGYGLKEKGGDLLTPTRKELDLLNHEEVMAWFKKNQPTVVIIAAAKVGGIYANSTQPYNFLLENLKIQNNIIEAAFKNQVKRLLFLGSSCIYPKLCTQPIKEEYLLNGELEITNQWYAIAKISGIKLCQALREQYNFDAISLMPTNLYGPNDNYHPTNSHVMPGLINKFINAKNNSLHSVTCWGTGKPLREFMHVDDLASAILFCLENWSPGKGTYPVDEKGEPLTFLNVGTGNDISIKELSQLIARISDFDGKIIWDDTKPDGTPKKLLNIDKIKSLGWLPSIKLEEGLKSTISDFCNF